MILAKMKIKINYDEVRETAVNIHSSSGTSTNLLKKGCHNRTVI